jgi:hypothetical protein
VRTNRGLVFQATASEPLQLLCNDAYGASLSEIPPVLVAPDGLLLATYAEGLVHITPDGCQAEPPDVGRGDRQVSDLAATSDGSRFFALLPPSPTQAGAILLSSDHGSTWSAAAELTSFGTALAVAPSDPARVYVSALSETTDGSAANELLVSVDGAATFASRPFELAASEVRAFVLAIDSGNPDRVFLRALPGNPDMPERLLLSEDAGRTFSEVFSALGPLVLTRVNDDWWLGGKAGLFRSIDGGKTFTPVPEAPSYVGCVRGSDGGLEVCGYQDNEFGIFSGSQDGTSFSANLRFRDVTHQAACGSDVIDTCRANFEDWLSEVAPPDDNRAGATAGGAANPTQSTQGASSNGAKGNSSCSFGARGPGDASLALTWLSCLVWAATRRTRRRAELVPEIRRS